MYLFDNSSVIVDLLNLAFMRLLLNILKLFWIFGCPLCRWWDSRDAICQLSLYLRCQTFDSGSLCMLFEGFLVVANWCWMKKMKQDMSASVINENLSNPHCLVSVFIVIWLQETTPAWFVIELCYSSRFFFFFHIFIC